MCQKSPESCKCDNQADDDSSALGPRLPSVHISALSEDAPDTSAGLGDAEVSLASYAAIGRSTCCSSACSGCCLVVRRLRQQRYAITSISASAAMPAPTPIPTIVPVDRPSDEFVEGPVLSVSFTEGPSRSSSKATHASRHVEAQSSPLFVMDSSWAPIAVAEELLENPGPGACANHHFNVPQFAPRKASCRNALPRTCLPGYPPVKHGKYCVGRLTSGLSRVRFRWAKGTRIAMSALLSVADCKVKESADAEDTIFLYWSDLVSQR